MSDQNATQDNRIETLIASGNLEEAHARFADFLHRCEEEKDALLSNQARFSRLMQNENMGLAEGASFEYNRILFDFVNTVRQFRKEVMAQYFDISEREQFLKQIADRDIVFNEILDIRLRSRNYQMEAMLTEGNSSLVYRLINHVLNRHAIGLVLKLPKIAEGTKTEIDRLADLRHRNIIKIIDHDLTAFPYLVITEYIYGTTLLKAVDTTGPRPVSQVADWLYQLADSLDYLRHKRIFHTNVRPSKIYVDDEWQLMLSPFDLKSISTGEASYQRFLDTCRYGSPEALSEFDEKIPWFEEKDDPGEEDHLLRKMCISDQYSLGLIGYKLLTGKDLVEGHTVYEMIESRNRFILDKAYRKKRLAELPKFDQGKKKAGISTIIEKLLEEDPALRYDDLHQVVRALHPLTRIEYQEVGPAHNSYRRCLSVNKEFIQDFYKAFFRNAPAAESDFDPLGKKRQLGMLQMAIDVLLDIDNRKDQLTRILDKEKHRKYTLPEFEVFIDTLIDTVRRNDPLFDSHTALEWTALRGRILEAIHEYKEKTSGTP